MTPEDRALNLARDLGVDGDAEAIGTIHETLRAALAEERQRVRNVATAACVDLIRHEREVCRQICADVAGEVRKRARGGEPMNEWDAAWECEQRISARSAP